MGWNHIETLQMGMPSNKERVGNVDEVDSSTKAKEKDMGKKKSDVDIVIDDKTRGTIMSEMGRYDVSTNVAVTTDTKYGHLSKK